MGISGDMFLIIIVSIAAVIVLEIAFGHFWGLQYEYTRTTSVSRSISLSWLTSLIINWGATIGANLKNSPSGVRYWRAAE